MMDGRILEEDHARGDVDVGSDQLEDRPAARTVAVPVEQAPVDVLVPAQREEVELLVVIERRVVT